MSHEHEDHVRIEAGQITHPDCFPSPNELVCIQVPKVFDQVALRDCIRKEICLESKGRHCEHPEFTFLGVKDFDIVDVKVIQKTDALNRPGFKKLKLAVKVKFEVIFTDGVDTDKICEEVTFNLTVNEIYCPNCTAQIGVVRYPHEKKDKMMDEDGRLIKVEALFEAFNEHVNNEGELSLDIGGFFIVKCECEVELLIPAYGYCPVPPEQANLSGMNCHVFNDRCKTPFPTSFFPNQKWNPLDAHEHHEC